MENQQGSQYERKGYYKITKNTLNVLLSYWQPPIYGKTWLFKEKLYILQECKFSTFLKKLCCCPSPKKGNPMTYTWSECLDTKSKSFWGIFFKKLCFCLSEKKSMTSVGSKNPAWQLCICWVTKYKPIATLINLDFCLWILGGKGDSICLCQLFQEAIKPRRGPLKLPYPSVLVSFKIKL